VRGGQLQLAVHEDAVKARGLALGVLMSVAACAHARGEPCPVRVTEAACAPVAADDPCTACLKARCCAPTVAWLNRGPRLAGAEAGACAEEHCNGACTRPAR
jgi:hypothetical protein